jgi:hypothetical protein
MNSFLKFFLLPFFIVVAVFVALIETVLDK